MSLDPSLFSHRTLAIPKLYTPPRRYTRRDLPVETVYSKICGSYALLFLSALPPETAQKTDFPSTVSCRVSHEEFLAMKTPLLSASRLPPGPDRPSVRIFTSENAGFSGGLAGPE